MRTSTFLNILPLLTTALAAPQPRLHPRSHGPEKRTSWSSYGAGTSDNSMGYQSMKSLHEMDGDKAYSQGTSGYEGMAEDWSGDQYSPSNSDTASPTAWSDTASPAAWSDSPSPPAWSDSPSPSAWSGATPPAEYTAAAASYSPPPPASSSPPWQYASSPPDDLNSCVQMCQAQFGGGMDSTMGMDQMGGGSAPPPSGTESAASSATTHTIIVAPTKGVLRFVPFATTANPGDTLHFIWGAGPHSSTLSLGQNVCNKSSDANAFDSGKLNASATFDTVYNGDPTQPQFHYCTVGMHCVSGMFGVVNPPTTNVSNALTDQALTPTPTEAAPGAGSTAGSGSGGCDGNSMDCWVERWMASSPEAQASGKAVKDACASAPGAWAWGGKFDMSSVESDSMPRKVMIENVMYTRLMLASNPSMINGTTPTDYVAVPDLNSFVAEKTGTNSTDTAYGGSGSGAASSSPSASAPAQSAEASGSATSAQDSAPSPSGGASSRITLTASSTLLGLFGVVLAWAL